ncbi:hypothetical protein [Pseudobacillus badius]|uniref:hypothetical protein n=1 Tax=Bacillus badius TaxID=1455 RepID=UPI0007B33824|nr:hypothetical protein [Bacillus badius]KZR60424.1 hypothetical protein A3781_09640 [Bacillus badius]
MDIKTIEEHVKATHSAYKQGILGVHMDAVHLTDHTFQKLLVEVGGQFKVENRDSEDYPFEVSFVNNGLTYYAIYSEKEMENKFGGNFDELITAN